MKSIRDFSLLDQLCLGVDQALRAVLNNPKTSGRPLPAAIAHLIPSTAEAKQQSARLMRINHAGEVCAQALYHGQGLVSRSHAVKEKMQQAALEEGDHLAWCHQRLMELGNHTSYLNPLWYAGSFVIGLTAGMIGDKWSLGFLAETENQVVNHLQNQLNLLPAEDQRSFHVLQQMQQDEAAHRDDALKAGAAILPDFIKKIMSAASKVMVKTTYWI